MCNSFMLFCALNAVKGMFIKMYKYRSKQISLTDFNTPVGMKLNPDNRWVKKAEIIPWDEMEQR